MSTQEEGLPGLNELVQLVNQAEMERNPLVIRLLRIIALEYDENLVRDVLEIIRPGLIRKSLNPDPFSPSPKGSDVDGLIRIGRVRGTGAPFGLNTDELNQHTLIVGRSGSGKTTIMYLMMLQLLKAGIPFMAFDFKRDYRHLLRYEK